MTRITWWCLLGVLAAAFWAPAKGQTTAPATYDPAHKFSQAEMRQDLTALRQVLEESHPGLYRYTPKKGMDGDFEGALQSVDRPMDEREFYAVVTGLLSQIKDGHTRAYLDPNYRKSLNTIVKRFPLRVRLLDGRLYVLASADAKVPPGSELLSIDGMPVPRITEVMVKHLSGDGDILAGKYAAIGDNFWLCYYLFVGQPATFKVGYRPPGGQRKRAELAGMTAEAAKELEDAADGSPQKPLRYELLPLPHAARLTIETFALPPPDKGGQDFPKFVAATFEQVRQEGIEDLVIDLRGNDGGDNLGLQLFSYLTDRPFLFNDSAEAVSQSFPLLHQYSHLGPDFTEEFEKKLVPAGDGHYRVEGNADLAPALQQPQKEPYLGRVWFLIDGEVFSATAQFCALARSHHRGIFVGEETGGAYHGNSSGEEAVITLPASQLRVVVPLLRYEMASSDPSAPRRGVIPDHPFRSTIQQLLGKKDAEIEYILRLIQQERQRETKQASRLFGPGEENIWFPYAAKEGHMALRKDVPCHPCHLDFCNRQGEGYMECMKLLSVDEVLAWAMKSLPSARNVTL